MAPVVTLLHPGSMGAAVGAQLRARGITVLWCPEGRSSATRRRADEAGLEGAPLGEALRRSDFVLSLCAPGAAEEVAERVMAHGLVEGAVFVEANPLAPERVAAVAARMRPTTVVDGAVVGSPPVGGKSPLLYLSGPSTAAGRVAGLFERTDVEARVVGEEVGQASVLKLIYSAYQKTSRVVAALAYGAADAYGVTDELLDVAGRRTRSYLVETEYIPKTAARAWRWAPDLADAADLLASVGLPADTVRAAAETLARWSPEGERPLDVTEALRTLRDAGP
ncbi:DUF1932 domain-containing protein [Streptomyces sp. TX20-6-3]|uniref:DUF1932 domain-containing protein n=1 Tax=Streptomyces sp. TX20-6-3 TaxID=3028705 RepID=UPI0029A99823|nr:DUF1932 domain-containing protein [Streptomyces sp. TX20-6-3]MDX2564063.1 DUF1932 domain-containing protein [Streptomyces sp. TX20-6-3]